MPTTPPVTQKIDICRQALLPAQLGASAADCSAALVAGGSALLQQVLSQDLAALWHHRLQAGNQLAALPRATADALHAARMAAAVAYLPQRAALAQLDALFAQRGIGYLVMKGVHVRECVYPDPALRAACDIDLLIAPAQRLAAARALQDGGFTPHLVPNNLSHEATFNRALVDVDLHWHMQRPGHTRTDMTAGFVARRQQTNDVWGLCDTDALFMMLTHPAFNKYVCSPNMGLARVADFYLWVQTRQPDWPAVRQLLHDEGVMTAAWAMLCWLRMLAPPALAGLLDGWLDSVRPGRLRAAYMRAWLRLDWPTRLINHPAVIQTGFTLPMHDRPADALRALQARWHAQLHQLRDARLLMGEDFSF